MKLGGKPFFCFSVLGFLGVGLGYAQVEDPVGTSTLVGTPVLTQLSLSPANPSSALTGWCLHCCRR